MPVGKADQGRSQSLGRVLVFAKSATAAVASRAVPPRRQNSGRSVALPSRRWAADVVTAVRRPPEPRRVRVISPRRPRFLQQSTRARPQRQPRSAKRGASGVAAASLSGLPRVRSTPRSSRCCPFVARARTTSKRCLASGAAHLLTEYFDPATRRPDADGLGPIADSTAGWHVVRSVIVVLVRQSLLAPSDVRPSP